MQPPFKSHGPADGPPAPRPAPRIPDYRLLHLIAQGSYGEVWMAENTFGTRRAVKLVYRDHFEKAEHYQRELDGVRHFEPLSRTHEALVDVLHVGQNEAEGWFHYVMELADNVLPPPPSSVPSPTGGRNLPGGVQDSGMKGALAAAARPGPSASLTGTPAYAPRTLLSELANRGRLPVMECVRIGLRLTEALEYLHGHHLVHRDVKPSNVVFVDGVPKLADIGLVTRTGAPSVVGTEGYVAPEGPGQPSADIYSLGKVLYELATGKDRRDFPDPLTNLDEQEDHAVLAEFNQVVLKACDPRPAGRHQTAAELKQELLLLAGKSVGEMRRLQGRLALLRRFGLATTLGLVAVGVALWFQWRQNRRMQELANESRDLLVRLNVAASTRALDEGDLMGTLPWCVAALKLEGGDAQRETMHRYRIEAIRRQCPRPIQMGFHDAAINHSTLSPDGQRLVTASNDGTARIWDLETGETLTPPLKHLAAVLWATFSPDGKSVATGGGDGVARIWDAQTGEPLTPPLLHGSNVVRIAFSPDGRLLATASWDGSARVFDSTTGQPTVPPLRHQGWVKTVAFSPDGRRLATGTEGNEASLWNPITGQRVLPPLRHPADLRHVAFSANGEKLVTACADGAARIWRTATGELAAPPMVSSDGGPVWWVAFSPDQRRLVTAGGRFGASGEVRAWDAATGKPAGPALRFPRPVRTAAFSPDGRWIATGCLDATARLWEVETAQPVGAPLKHQLAVWTTAFTADGRRLLTSGRDGSWHLWDLASEESIEPVMAHEGAWTLAFSPDGQYLATGGGDGRARLWEVRTRRLAGTPLRLGGSVWSVAFSPDSHWLAAASTNGLAAVWEVPTGRLRWSVLHHERTVRCVRFSPDGTHLATACEDGAARLWSAATGEASGAPMRCQYGVQAVCFSPDGRRLATGAGQYASHYAKGEVRIWNPATGALLTGPLEADGKVTAIVFSPDARWLLAATDDLSVRAHTVGAWETATGKPLGWKLRHDDGLEDIAFSPDGQFVATAGQDGAARLWRAEAGSPLVLTIRHPGNVQRIAFSRDGRRLLTGCNDGTARLWDAHTGQPLGPPLARHGDTILHCAWSPDERQVATISRDGTARLCEIRPTDWPIGDLTLLAEVLSGGRVDAAGKLEPLQPPAWRKAWRELMIRQPTAFQAASDQVVTWHRHQADESGRMGQREAARFHLRQLSALRPADLELSRRLDQIEREFDRKPPP